MNKNSMWKRQWHCTFSVYSPFRPVFPNHYWFSAPKLSLLGIWRGPHDGKIGLKINELQFMLSPLALSHGTLVCRGTPVWNHWFRQRDCNTGSDLYTHTLTKLNNFKKFDTICIFSKHFNFRDFNFYPTFSYFLKLVLYFFIFSTPLSHILALK